MLLLSLVLLDSEDFGWHLGQVKLLLQENESLQEMKKEAILFFVIKGYWQSQDLYAYLKVYHGDVAPSVSAAICANFMKDRSFGTIVQPLATRG